jgi:hypothetical protein
MVVDTPCCGTPHTHVIGEEGHIGTLIHGTV